MYAAAEQQVLLRAGGGRGDTEKGQGPLADSVLGERGGSRTKDSWSGSREARGIGIHRDFTEDQFRRERTGSLGTVIREGEAGRQVGRGTGGGKKPARPDGYTRERALGAGTQC